MQIIAHTMQYSGGAVCPPALQLRSYCDSDYEEYRRMYEDCFAEMRTALGLPVSCCDDREAMQRKRGKVFILEKDGVLAGSVAMYGNEIDDLVVARAFQRRGYGQALLRFALSALQKAGVQPICLRVADWNRGALAMYQKNGFQIVKTEVVR